MHSTTMVFKSIKSKIDIKKIHQNARRRNIPNSKRNIRSTTISKRSKNYTFFYKNDNINAGNGNGNHVIGKAEFQDKHTVNNPISNNNLIPILLTTNNLFNPNNNNNNNNNSTPRSATIIKRKKLLLSKNLRNNILRYNNNNSSNNLTTSHLQLQKNHSHYSTIALNGNSNEYCTDAPNNVEQAPNDNSVQDAEDNCSPWEIDNETCLNKSTYLQAHIKKIDEAFEKKDFNFINPLYQSLKRNDCIPPIETYYKILYSICNRDLDSNDLNYKMFQILSCYEDIIIKNKLKPNEQIYNLLLENLFKGSINSFKLNDYKNGLDFFKISLEIFLQIFEKYTLSDDRVIRSLLSAINYYPNLISQGKINYILNKINFNFEENYQLYFQSLINYSILTNDSTNLNILIEKFDVLTENGITNKNLDYKIWSLIIKGLIEVNGNLSLSTQFLDSKINEIKSNNGFKSNINLLVSNYLISISKIDPNKSHQLLLNFQEKLIWLDEFDYSFYLELIFNSKNDWNLIKFYYNKLHSLKINESLIDATSNNINSTKLINYNYNNSVESNLAKFFQIIELPNDLHLNQENSINDFILNNASRFNDAKILTKIINDSTLRNTKFSDLNSYDIIFEFFKENNYPTDSIINFIELHGSLIIDSTNKDSSAQQAFAQVIIDSFVSLILTKFSNDKSFILQLIETTTFINYCKQIDFFNINSIDLLLKIFNDTIWKSPKTVELYPILLNLYSIMILNFNHFEMLLLENNVNEHNDFISNPDSIFNNFKDIIEHQYKSLIVNFSRLQLNTSILSNQVFQSIKLIDFPKEIMDFYKGNFGDWDKSYPIALGPMIRNSNSTGLKEFIKLSDQNYTFDYDTYKSLINLRSFSDFFEFEIIENAIKLCPLNDKLEINKLINMIIKKLNSAQLKKLLSSVHLQFFKSHFLNNLNDLSLLKLSLIYSQNGINFLNFLELVNFPKNYNTIKNQTEFKKSITFIYEQLFVLKYFKEIITFNHIAPVLNLEILLKSHIRLKDYENFEKLFHKFDNLLSTEEKVLLKSEYFLSISKPEEVLTLIQTTIGSNSNVNLVEKFSAIYTFSIFALSVEDPEKANSISLEHKSKNFIELANILSSQSKSFFQMINSFESSSINDANKEILQIMLDNYHSIASKELSNHKVLNGYLDNFFKFKCYLKQPLLSYNDLNRILDIWFKTNNPAVKSLLNNFLDSRKLNPTTNSVYLLNDIVFFFKNNELLSIVNKIKSFYQVNEVENKVILKKIDDSFVKITDF